MKIKTNYCDKVRSYGSSNEFTNFGDILNPFIFAYFNISIECDNINPKLYAIGSILNNIPDNFQGIIWSSGCLFPKKVNYKLKQKRFKRQR